MIDLRRTTFGVVAWAMLTASPSIAIEDATDTLPNAQPGECYAKVMTPPQFKTETKTVVTREASQKIEIVPAKYETVTEKVLVSEASTKLVPVPAVYETKKEIVEVRPARVGFVTGSLKSNLAANPQILRAAADGGVNLDSAPVGKCYHEHFQAAKYETKTERMLVAEASETVSVIPAKYEMVTEKVLVTPASTKLVEVPATYETIEEKVLVEAAKSVWKKGRGLVERLDNSTGDIMCLVEVPAKYKVVKKRVVKTPATTKTVEIPAKYNNVQVRKLKADAQEVRKEQPAKYKEVAKQVKISDDKYVWHPVETPGNFGPKTGNVICKRNFPAKTETVVRRVVKTPATFTKVEVPAKYTTKKVRKLVSAATEKRISIPEETNTVSQRVKVSDARLEWKSVLCETNMSPGVITSVQRALKSAGFDPGPVDGVIGRGTLTAVDAFQQKKGLASGGLTYDTLKALGVKI